MDTQDKDKFFTTCQCGCSAISVEKAWQTTNGERPEVLFSVWFADKQSFTWKFRIREAWNLLRRGYTLCDEVVLKESQAVRLVDAINDIIHTTE